MAPPYQANPRLGPHGGADVAPQGAVLTFLGPQGRIQDLGTAVLDFPGLGRRPGVPSSCRQTQGTPGLVCAGMTGVSFSSHSSGLRHAASESSGWALGGPGKGEAWMGFICQDLYPS